MCPQVPIDGDASLLTEDYLYNVFLFPVNKAEALAYLDEGGPLPGRYAKVIAIRGAHAPPDVMEYKVCFKHYPAAVRYCHITQLQCLYCVKLYWIRFKPGQTYSYGFMIEDLSHKLHAGE